jgi:hypothetical protein
MPTEVPSEQPTPDGGSIPVVERCPETYASINATDKEGVEYISIVSGQGEILSQQCCYEYSLTNDPLISQFGVSWNSTIGCYLGQEEPVLDPNTGTQTPNTTPALEPIKEPTTQDPSENQGFVLSMDPTRICFEYGPNNRGPYTNR